MCSFWDRVTDKVKSRKRFDETEAEAFRGGDYFDAGICRTFGISVAVLGSFMGL